MVENEVLNRGISSPFTFSQIVHQPILPQFQQTRTAQITLLSKLSAMPTSLPLRLFKVALKSAMICVVMGVIATLITLLAVALYGDEAGWKSMIPSDDFLALQWISCSFTFITWRYVEGTVVRYHCHR